MSAAVIAKFCQPRGLGRIAGECIQRQPAGLRLFFAKKIWKGWITASWRIRARESSMDYRPDGVRTPCQASRTW